MISNQSKTVYRRLQIQAPDSVFRTNHQSLHILLLFVVLAWCRGDSIIIITKPLSTSANVYKDIDRRIVANK